MAFIEKRGDAWRAQVRKKGVTDSATFATKRAATEWANKRETDIVLIAQGMLPKKTAAQALTKYSEEESPKHDGARWEKVRCKALQRAKWTSKQLSEVTATDLAEWRDERMQAVSAGSVLREMRLLNSVFEVARKEWKWIHANPLKDVKRPKSPKSRSTLISDEQVAAMVVGLGDINAPIVTYGQQVNVMFQLALETAMRAGEMHALEWRDLKGRHLTLRDSKNDDSRDVPLSSKARALLERMRGVDEVRIFTVEAASRDALFRKVRSRLGLSGFTFHDSRANALTMLAGKLDILELARMVGHRDTRSLLIYYRKSADSIADKLG